MCIIDEEKIANFDELNFAWDAGKAQCLENFNELKEFYNATSHTHAKESNSNEPLIS